MEIRECSSEDFDGVVPLLAQLWPEKELDLEALRETFDEYQVSRVHECICAVEDDLLVGFCTLFVLDSLYDQGRLGYLDILVVDEGSRGRGIGEALLDQAEDIARTLGCGHIALDSAFRREDAHDFYKNRGYEDTGIMFEKWF